MRYGDKDGFKEIYDENGELILHPSEKILVTEENVVPSFKSTWRYYGGDYLLEPSKGTIYLTNERFVFINIPERMFAIGGDETRAMDAPIESTFELGNISQGASIREYFEIPNIEIMGSENKEGAVSVGEMVNVYILSSGNQFHLSMVLNSESNLLMRLMNKKVETLDELVNNLKDFFRKTDWMFVDGETKTHPNLDDVDVLGDQGREISSVPEVPSKPVQTKAAPIPDNSVAAPINQLNLRRRIPATPEVNNRSMEYFDTLHQKGLIKEEIYQKILLQYRISNPPAKTSTRSVSPPQPPSSDEGIQNAPPVDNSHMESGPGEPDQPPVQGSEDESDDDILNMLNDTLTDLSGDEASPEGETQIAPNASAQAPKVVRAKKVHKPV